MMSLFSGDSSYPSLASVALSDWLPMTTESSVSMGTLADTSIVLSHHSHHQHHNNQQQQQQQVPNFRELVLSSYLITFTLGIVGNSLVIFVIAYYGDVRRKSVANFYILNLAAADLAFVFSLPFFCYATATKHWPFGSLACKLLTTTREVNRYASVYTLVALSVDRLLASFYYCARWRTPLKGKVICIIIWAASLGISLPYFIFSEVTTLGQGQTVSCRTMWPIKNQRSITRLMTYFDFIVAFTVPIIAIFVSYGILAYRTRRMATRHASRSRNIGNSRQRHQNHYHYHQPLHQLQHQHQRLQVQTLTTPTKAPATTSIVVRVSEAGATRSGVAKGAPVPRRRPSVQMTRTVLAIVLIFVICHTPNSAMQLVAQRQRERVEEAIETGQALQPNVKKMLVFAYMNSIALVLLFLNSCVNPIIYGLSNRNFRQLYIDAIRKCCSLVCRSRHCPSSDRQGAAPNCRSVSNAGGHHHRQRRLLEMATLDQAAGRNCSATLDPAREAVTSNVDYLALPNTVGSPRRSLTNLMSSSSFGSRLYLSSVECTKA